MFCPGHKAWAIVYVSHMVASVGAIASATSGSSIIPCANSNIDMTAYDKNTTNGNIEIKMISLATGRTYPGLLTLAKTVHATAAITGALDKIGAFGMQHNTTNDNKEVIETEMPQVAPVYAVMVSERGVVAPAVTSDRNATALQYMAPDHETPARETEYERELTPTTGPETGRPTVEAARFIPLGMDPGGAVHIALVMMLLLVMKGRAKRTVNETPIVEALERETPMETPAMNETPIVEALERETPMETPAFYETPMVALERETPMVAPAMNDLKYEAPVGALFMMIGVIPSGAITFAGDGAPGALMMNAPDNADDEDECYESNVVYWNEERGVRILTIVGCTLSL